MPVCSVPLAGCVQLTLSDEIVSTLSDTRWSSFIDLNDLNTIAGLCHVDINGFITTYG